MDLGIRDGVPGDEPAIVMLIRALGEAGDYESPIREEDAARYLASPGCGVLLAEEDGGAVGLLSYSIRFDLFHAANSCLIDELVVAEGRRGQGIGGALLDEVLRRARSAGCVEVSVTTMPDNAGAQALYRSKGLDEEAVFLEMHLS
ncbi:MAG TPA: GNAT family N-acetyltransferase [Anaerolineae bacterium]|nr:GNAT family N-acetyltransferase [Anaerolineae bacterium]